MNKVLLVFGTRPDAIKMVPVARALSKQPNLLTEICVTGQHREMLSQVLTPFGVEPKYSLDIMGSAKGLEETTSAVLRGITSVIDTSCPNRILVHGDTTTAMATALAAFYRKVPVGHVEAGLRSGDMSQPWPEEANRRIISLLSDLHFAPTPSSKENLLAEGVPERSIVITGNTIIDMLQMTVARLEAESRVEREVAEQFAFLDASRPILLVTGHRRENFGTPLRNLCEAIRELTETTQLQVVYPVHLNPSVKQPVYQLLAGAANVHLIEPLEYIPFVYLMLRSHMILTDSGGIQEEGPSLGKPVLVMRNVTERPEALAAGNVILVGTDRERIVSEVKRLLIDKAVYRQMSRSVSPYGDGQAAERIASMLATGVAREFRPKDNTR